jgi:hypothetical protein
MSTIRIRGGSFAAAARCAFEADHFSFAQTAGLFANSIRIHVREVARARVVESTVSSLSFKNAASGAGGGAVIGLWFGPFAALAGAVIGSVIGANSGNTVSEVTFEAEFKDGRALVGTIDPPGWNELLRSWHLSRRPLARPREELIADDAAPVALLPAPQTTRQRNLVVAGLSKLAIWR